MEEMELRHLGFLEGDDKYFLDFIKVELSFLALNIMEKWTDKSISLQNHIFDFHRRPLDFMSEVKINTLYLWSSL
jgi:hypothetical protein